jgi:hypothetical protein
MSWIGYVGVFLLPALHAAFWRRADFLGGFWGHTDEASRWLQTIDLTSLLVVLCSLFGVGWKKWVSVACGSVSFAFACMYAMGL